ncbi:uncharacterized protein [Leptinotarsa decemlineata]|uniref:uncharacterized protein n=1 Tax=Leptinotarsa decemlineata TaxID=7539 RepID=UPI003D303EF6
MLVKVMDSVILQFVWICYIIYNVFWSLAKSGRKLDSPNQLQLTTKNHIDRRHFIHLYTCTSNTGKQTCCMDVYQLLNPSDEEKLRIVFSKGAPTKTYLRHNQRHNQYFPTHGGGIRP